MPRRSAANTNDAERLASLFPHRAWEQETLVITPPPDLRDF